MPAADLSSARPLTGSRVTLHVVATDAVLSARVDAVMLPDRMLLAEPVDPEGCHVEPLATGSDLLVVWTTPVGRHEVPATMAGLVHDRVPLWRVEARSSPRVEQRRGYARAPDSLRGELHYGQLWSKLVVLDLSEGGARCVVRDPGTLPVGGLVQLRTVIDDVDVLLDAVLLAADPEDPLGERVQVRVQFVDLGPVADLVRKRVLEQQRKARASVRLACS